MPNNPGTDNYLSLDGHHIARLHRRFIRTRRQRQSTPEQELMELAQAIAEIRAKLRYHPEDPSHESVRQAIAHAGLALFELANLTHTNLKEEMLTTLRKEEEQYHDRRTGTGTAGAGPIPIQRSAIPSQRAGLPARRDARG